MSFLYLVRHGEAMSELDDPERPLTKGGRSTVQRMAAWAAAAGCTVQEVRHSGILRAEQTADIFARQLGLSEMPTAMTGLHPNDDVRPVAASVFKLEHSLMLVGHLPFLGRLASLLVAGDINASKPQFEAGALVGLEKQERAWSITCAMQPTAIP